MSEQEYDRAMKALQTVNFWLDEFSVKDATPEAVAVASKLQGDVLRKRLGEMHKELRNLRAEIELLRIKEQALEGHRRVIDSLEAEVERLKWEREAACENTPTSACECPGCNIARERAERGEA